MSRRTVLGDWGTTRLRLFLMEGAGGGVCARLDGPGALVGDPHATLAERLERWQAEHGPIGEVLLCGMAGAAGGIAPAGYAPCPASPAQWLASRAQVRVAGTDVSVLPGLSHHGEGQVPEVMRGEEAQVFGAMALVPGLAQGRHTIVLPGTHSKWVQLDDGRITGFRTHPTGELFALLSGQSTLTGPDTPGEGLFDDGFLRGLERAGEALTGALFEARAARMLDGKSKDWSRGYLSGLLIGGEVTAAMADAAPDKALALIGDPALAALYERALAHCGTAVRNIDGDSAVLAGLGLARDTLAKGLCP